MIVSQNAQFGKDSDFIHIENETSYGIVIKFHPNGK